MDAYDIVKVMMKEAKSYQVSFGKYDDVELDLKGGKKPSDIIIIDLYDTPVDFKDMPNRGR